MTALSTGKEYTLLYITRWRNYEQYALYLSVHCAALRKDISAFVRRYLCPRPQISLPSPADISIRKLSYPD